MPATYNGPSGSFVMPGLFSFTENDKGAFSFIALNNPIVKLYTKVRGTCMMAMPIAIRDNIQKQSLMTGGKK